RIATGSKVTDEQFTTNIAYPVQNAVDSGIPTSVIEKELRGGLEAARLPKEEIDELVKKAIPEEYKQAEQLGKLVAEEMPVTPTTAQGIIDLRTPDDGSIVVPLTSSDFKLKGQFRSR